MSERAQPQASVVDVVAIAPSPHEGDESVQSAALDTASRARAGRALGAAALGLVAVAALLIPNVGAGSSGSASPASTTSTSTAGTLSEPRRDSYQSRYNLQPPPARVPALYGMEGGPPFCVPTVSLSD